MKHSLATRSASMLLAIVAGLVIQVGAAAAATFTVTPTRVDLAGGNASTLLTLNNESTEAIRFQITASAWTQSDVGEIQLKPTDDILFFPALLTLGPGESKKVRVASSMPAGEIEKTYRIFFEELPPLETQDTQQGTAVRILTKMGVPIFISPAKRHVHAAIEAAELTEGGLTFDVTNSGTVRYSVHSAKVVGLAADGAQLFEKEQGGWYVLAGGKRAFEFELSPEDSKGLASLRIEVNTDQSADSGFAKLTSTVEVQRTGSS